MTEIQKLILSSLNSIYFSVQIRPFARNAIKMFDILNHRLPFLYVLYFVNCQANVLHIQISLLDLEYFPHLMPIFLHV
jgi:hypothetical protein